MIDELTLWGDGAAPRVSQHDPVTGKSDLTTLQEAHRATRTTLEIVSGPERCPHCSGPTQRTGSCHTCIVCGSTTGCG